MKIEVGMYVRFKANLAEKIGKFKGFKSDGLIILIDNTEYWFEKEDIKKASHNIIDLIEVGDYVNGSKVANIVQEDGQQYLVLDRDEVYYDSCLEPSSDEDIKSILTKEQFEREAYKI